MCSEATRRRIGFGSTLVCVFFGLALAASGRAEDVVADETQGSTAARATEAGREETEVEDTPGTPTLASARRLADHARVAVLEGLPDAAIALAHADRASRALGLADRATIELALHVARSRMLAASPATDEVEAIREALVAIDAAATLHDAPNARAFAHVYRAALAETHGRVDEAMREAERALLVPEDESVWPAHVESLALIARLEGRAARPDPALGALRRARDVLSRHRARLAAADFLARAEPIHRDLADRLLRQTARTPDETQPLLREALEALEDLKVARLREYFGEACLTNLVATTPERLPGATLLYPVVLEDRVVLLVGREGRLDAIEAPIDPATLRETSERLRRALQDPTTPRFRKPAAALYEALIRPLPKQALAEGTTLVVVATGALREIPPASLYDERSGRFLIESTPVAVLPTLRILPPQPIDRHRARLLVAGYGEASPGFEALPAVEREIASVGAAFPATRRAGAEFTIEGFEQTLEERPFDLLHIASHGRFDADAAESYLVTADGRLGLEELARIIARTRHRTSRPIELLTLSACETALGDEASVLGLAGVAVQSGARSAVATLWRVNDEATARLFEVFYDELARPERSRASALQAAQQALLSEKRFRHPVYWSPFLLVNSWR